MYYKLFKPLLLSLLFCHLSCSEENSSVEPTTPEIPKEVVDTHNYIALRNDGTLFSIGNNSGNVSQAGRIPGIEFNTIFNAVTSSDSKLYIYEHRFDPPRGILYILDKESGTTESTILDFSEAGFGENTGLISLDWDNEKENLVGITRQDMEQGNYGRPIKVVRINPENFQIEAGELDLGPDGYEYIFSSSLVGQKLFVTASKNDRIPDADVLEIDLDENSYGIASLPENTSTIINMGHRSNSVNLFGFSPVVNSGLMGEVRPVIYNFESNDLQELAEVPRISGINMNHKTIFSADENVFVQLIAANQAINLFKYNPSEEVFQIVKLQNSENLSTLVAIVGVEEI